MAPFAAKKHFSEMVWHLIDIYVINRTLHGRLEIRNFSSCVNEISLLVLENTSLVRCAHP